MGCIVCKKTESTRWYYNKTTCRSCHRKAIYWKKPKNLETLNKKLFPKCFTCSKVESKRWFKKRTQCSSCYSKEYKMKNKDSIKNRITEYRNENREKINNAKRKRRNLNPWSHRLEAKLRKKGVKNATPSWLNKKDLLVVWKGCPENMQVDHIIPLKSKNVCGLNVPWNLQYLKPYENNKKNNQFDGTYENESWKTCLPIL